MNKILKYTILILLAFAVNSCIFTSFNTVSFLDKVKINDSRIFSKVAVRCNDQDLLFSDKMERELAYELFSAGIYSKRSLDIYPPMNEWNQDEFLRRLKDSGMNGLFEIEVIGADNQEWIVPEKRTVTVHRDTVKTKKGTKIKKSVERDFQPSHLDSHTFYTIKASFTDLSTGEVVWTAQSRSKAGWKSDSFLFDYSREIVEAFLEDIREK